MPIRGFRQEVLQRLERDELFERQALHGDRAVCTGDGVAKQISLIQGKQGGSILTIAGGFTAQGFGKRNSCRGLLNPRQAQLAHGGLGCDGDAVDVLALTDKGADLFHACIHPLDVGAHLRKGLGVLHLCAREAPILVKGRALDALKKVIKGNKDPTGRR